MGRVTELKGNLITLAKEDKFEVVVHGCNCFCTMGAGLAPQMAAEFGADTFTLEQSGLRGDYNKLGQIDYVKMYLEDTGKWTRFPDESGEWIEAEVTVINAYTQYHYGKNHKDGVENPVDYLAIQMVFRKMNHIFKGKHIGVPRIGAGLAGGDWDRIKKIILDELVDCDVTLVEFDK